MLLFAHVGGICKIGSLGDASASMALLSALKLMVITSESMGSMM